jgi:hypothetical protein
MRMATAICGVVLPIGSAMLLDGLRGGRAGDGAPSDKNVGPTL